MAAAGALMLLPTMNACGDEGGPDAAAPTASRSQGGRAGVNAGGGTSSQGAAGTSNPTSEGGAGGASVNLTTRYLHTDGGRIVDDAGATVVLKCTNWSGIQSPTMVPDGLWKQPPTASRTIPDMVAQIRSLGFNCLRIPYTDEIFQPNLPPPDSVDFDANAVLKDKTRLEVLDFLIEQAGLVGLQVILDRHCGKPDQLTPLWFTDAVPESTWIEHWKNLAERYKNNANVIGADLHNEPHPPATWGDDSPNDWRLGAERAGNAILAIEPRWLIVVEGIGNFDNVVANHGGNLAPAGRFPVRLTVDKQLVYSAHEYPQSVIGSQSWFERPSFPDGLPTEWDKRWGYLVKQNVAPVWIGEFGSKLETEDDKTWLRALVSYAQSNTMGFAFWTWNPNSGDTGGLLKSDVTTIEAEKVQILGPLLQP